MITQVCLDKGNKCTPIHRKETLTIHQRGSKNWRIIRIVEFHQGRPLLREIVSHEIIFQILDTASFQMVLLIILVMIEEWQSQSCCKSLHLFIMHINLKLARNFSYLSLNLRRCPLWRRQRLIRVPQQASIPSLRKVRTNQGRAKWSIWPPMVNLMP